MKSVIRLSGLVFLVSTVLMSVSALPANAATPDEIVAMTQAGIPSDVIIDVIDATGFEGELDADTLTLLIDSGVDESVVNYLLSKLEDGGDIEAEVSGQEAWGADITDHPNWVGGEGFHGRSRERGRQDDYWEGRSYYEDHYGPGYGIVVYEPPVYILDNHPYYHAYRAPRYYRYNRGYWHDGMYVIYDNSLHVPYTYTGPGSGGYYWDGGYGYGHDNWPYDGWFGHGYGGWYNNGWGRGFDSSFDAWYRDDDFGLHIRL